MLSILLRVTSDVALHQATSLCKFELAALQVSHDEIFFWVLSENGLKFNTMKRNVLRLLDIYLNSYICTLWSGTWVRLRLWNHSEFL